MKQPQPEEIVPHQTDDPPPLLGTWPRLYAAVLIHLVVWILVFYFFTERFHLPS